MVFHLMTDRMDTSMYGPFFTKVRHFRIKPSPGRFPDRLHQIFQTFILDCADRNHRNAELFFHLIKRDRAAVSPHFIHHVKRQHHRDVHFE